MPKDTKSSGNNKAPACESRGFGHKKEGENFDTPSCIESGIGLLPVSADHPVLRSATKPLQAPLCFLRLPAERIPHRLFVSRKQKASSRKATKKTDIL